MRMGAACGVCSLPVAPHVQMRFETFWAEMLEGIWSRDEETVLEVKRSRDAGGSLWLLDCPQVSTAKSCPREETLNSHSHSSQKQPSRCVDGMGSGEGRRAGVRVLGVHQQGGGPALPSPHPSSLACADHKLPHSFCSPDASEAANPALDASKKWKKTSGRGVSVAARKLLAGAERLSHPTQLLPGSSAEQDVQLVGTRAPTTSGCTISNI